MQEHLKEIGRLHSKKQKNRKKRLTFVFLRDIKINVAIFAVFLRNIIVNAETVNVKIFIIIYGGNIHVHYSG